jgi:homoserine dehydrogenase
VNKIVRVGLVGYGRVGRTFAQLVDSQRQALLDSLQVDPRLVLIRRSETQAEPGDTGGDLAWTEAESLSDAVTRLGIDVVVQAVPSSPALVQTAKDQTLDAMRSGANVVTATKSHLVEYWADLQDAAISAGRSLRISAATGAALPTADLCRRGFRAFPCRSFRASLNGTSNYVVGQLRRGLSLDDAIAEAVARGICEPNPVDDISGRDAAMKLVLLANLLWEPHRRLSDVVLERVDGDELSELVAEAERQELVLCSVATADGNASPALRVGHVLLEPSDPLARLRGAEKAVEFDLDLGGSVIVSGGASSPEGAGLALLKDLANLATGDGGLGFA